MTARQKNRPCCHHRWKDWQGRQVADSAAHRVGADEPYSSVDTRAINHSPPSVLLAGADARAAALRPAVAAQVAPEASEH